MWDGAPLAEREHGCTAQASSPSLQKTHAFYRPTIDAALVTSRGLFALIWLCMPIQRDTSLLSDSAHRD